MGWGGSFPLFLRYFFAICYPFCDRPLPAPPPHCEVKTFSSLPVFSAFVHFISSIEDACVTVIVTGLLLQHALVFIRR
jgi:hypothetical protein